ncbi:unnamed protein product, partial [Pylaiella littoralis]
MAMECCRGSRSSSFSYVRAVEGAGHALTGLAGFLLLPLFHTQLFFFLLESMGGNVFMLCLGWVLVPSLVIRIPRLRRFAARHLRVLEAVAGCFLAGSLAAGAAGLLTVRLAMSAAGLSVFWGGCQMPHWGRVRGSEVMDGLITGNHLALILHLGAGLYSPPSPDLRFLRSLALPALLLLGLWAVPPCYRYRRRYRSSGTAWRYLRLADTDGNEDDGVGQRQQQQAGDLELQRQHQSRPDGREDTTDANAVRASKTRETAVAASTVAPAAAPTTEATADATAAAIAAVLPPLSSSLSSRRWWTGDILVTSPGGESLSSSPPCCVVQSFVASAGFGGLLFLTALLVGSPWTGDDWAPSPGLGATWSALRQASVVFAWALGRYLAAPTTPATASAAAAAAAAALSSTQAVGQRQEEESHGEGRVHHHHHRHPRPEGGSTADSSAEREDLIIVPSSSPPYLPFTSAAAAAAVAAGIAVGRQGRRVVKHDIVFGGGQETKGRETAEATQVAEEPATPAPRA